MSLFRLISWPYFRKHVLRTVLTTCGIVLGVTVFVGMRTANQRVLAAFSQTVDRIAGKTELQVTAGETGFGEEILDKVQSASTVRVAVPVIEAVVDSNIRGQGNLLVLGIDMTGDRSLREYDVERDGDDEIEDPLEFLAQPDSLMLSQEFTARNHIARGDRLQLGTVDGLKVFTVRGIMRSSALTSAFGGNLAIMDVYAAQKVFGRGRLFDRIELATKSTATIAECQRELSNLLGAAFQIRPPSSRGEQFEAMLAGYTMMVGISSAFALFIGMFIIYNAFAIAVTERRKEIGILRALGATQGQIRRLFLAEGAVMGLAGSLVGVALGIVAARAIAVYVSTLIADVYGVAQRSDDAAIASGLLVLAVLMGAATSVIAAAIPAMNAARVDPVHALQKGTSQRLSAGESRLRAWLAAACGVVSAVCLTTNGNSVVLYAGYVALIGLALLLGPALSFGLAKAFRPALKWLRPVEGAMAADSLIQAPRRTSATVAALMLSLALIIAFEGMARASYNSIVDWVSTTLDPDLFVMPSQNLDVQTIRFPAAMGPEIAAVPGVERVQMLRNARIRFRDLPVMVVAIEMSSVAQTRQLPPVAGTADVMYRTAAAGDGLLVSENLAQLQHLRLGETLEIPAPYGFLRLPIVGIVVDYSDQQGAILVDRRVFMNHWHDDSVNVFRVYLKRGAAIADVRRDLLERYAGRRQVFVLTNDELRRYVMKVTGQWYTLTSVQIVVALLVAILGIVNTLTVSITDRRRELGVLRALGGLHGQVRRTIWLEALSVGAFGLILGSALGAANLFYVLQIVHRDIVGIQLRYQFPLTMALGLVPLILGAAFVAAIWPAESAVRGSLRQALEYE